MVRWVLISCGMLLTCASCKFSAATPEKPGECVTDVQCDTNQACARGQCRSLCDVDGDCTDQVCDGGVCTPGARVDCAGVIGGTSLLDDCGRCGALSIPPSAGGPGDPYPCRTNNIDCVGVAGGQRANNACGNCSLTIYERDCHDLDCAGQRRATADAAARDCCDVCREPGETKCELNACGESQGDCSASAGTATKAPCGGDCAAAVDQCGLCTGGSTGKVVCAGVASGDNPLQVAKGVTRNTGAILTAATYSLDAASLVLFRFTLKSQLSLPWIQSVTLTWPETGPSVVHVDVYAMTDWPSTDGNIDTVAPSILSTALSGLPVATSLGVTSNTREIKAFDETSEKPAFPKLIQAVQNAYDQGKNSIVFALVVPSGSATAAASGATLSYGTLESRVITLTYKKRLDPSTLTLKDPVTTDNPDTLSAGTLFFEFTESNPSPGEVIGARLLVPIVSVSSLQSTVSVVVDQVNFARTTTWSTSPAPWFDPSEVLATAHTDVDKTKVANTFVNVRSTSLKYAAEAITTETLCRGVNTGFTCRRYIYRVTPNNPADILIVAAGDGASNNPTPRLHLARQNTSP